MTRMSPETRAHEEQRMQLDYTHAEVLRGIDANQAIAKEQAAVLARALQQAKIEIVGGDGEYFERFMRSLSIGKAIDGTVDHSKLLSKAFADHKAGKRDLIEDAKELVGALGGADGVRDLSVAALMQKLAAGGNAKGVEVLKKLLGDDSGARRARGTGVTRNPVPRGNGVSSTGTEKLHKRGTGHGARVVISNPIPRGNDLSSTRAEELHKPGMEHGARGTGVLSAHVVDVGLRNFL